VTARLDHAVRLWEPRPFGMGCEWRVRRSQDQDPDAPGTIVLDGLQTHRFGLGSRLCTALRDVAKGTSLVYFMVDGAWRKPEDLVVQIVDATGKAGWNKTDRFDLPLRIPADAAEVRVRIAPGAFVRRLRFWRVDVPESKGP